MHEITNHFEEGVVFGVFQSRMNIIIWKKIAEEVEFLNTQTKEKKQLYAYLQHSATTNFVLHTAKLFDTQNKKYPTRCILSFLELVKEKATLFPSIIETTNTIKLLEEYNAPKELIISVKSNDPTLFPLNFYTYYKEKYDSDEIKQRITNLKDTRDKKIAHNELLEKQINLELESIESLLSYVIEIISIFRQAYYHSTLRIDNDAERNAFFITDSINELKNKKPS
jgi:hypothetical protein